ncbi:MAG: DoxX family membrane protein [Euryarchaeota archaeon]|nr:DoxX family membrane protein [Euryarchaeota archaeon]
MTDITDILFLLGRLLLGSFFLMSAWSHLTNVKGLAPYAAAKGVPAPALAVFGTGVLLAAGGLSLLLGLYPLVGLGALALFLVGTTPKMHAYWKETDPMAKMGEQVNFMKNTALLGAVLALAVVTRPWPYALAF